MKEFFEHKLILSESIGCHYVASGKGIPVHRNRSMHGLVYYSAHSKLFSFIGGPVLHTRQGGIIYLPKGADYNVIEAGEEDLGCWCINFLTINELKCAPFVMEFRNFEKVQNLFCAAQKVSNERRTAYDPKLRSIFYEIIALMEQEFNSKYLPSSKARRLVPAIDHIKQNCFDRNIDINQLASLCGVSTTYFRRLFAETYGISPVKYINSIRIKRAKELMDSQMYASVVDIASLCGFSDDCYFRKVFKAETLQTPSEYMRNKKTPFGQE